MWGVYRVGGVCMIYRYLGGVTEEVLGVLG